MDQAGPNQGGDRTDRPRRADRGAVGCTQGGDLRGLPHHRVRGFWVSWDLGLQTTAGQGGFNSD